MGAPSNVFAKFMNIPLLGPVYLATIADRAGFEASVLNENIVQRKIRRDDLASVDILCLSCITTTVQRGEKIAQEYRNIRQAMGLEARTLIGGIHASMMPEDVAPYFDQVIVGEADKIILDVLCGNITDKIVYGEQLKDLDEQVIPDFKLVKDWEKITIRPVMTSRGCPYNCNFCSVTAMFGRGYRTRSVEHVMEEIMQYKTGRVFFADDHFTANIKRSDRLLDMMIEQGFDRPWSAQVRTEVTQKPELVAKMRKAGCNTVYVGFESVNPQSLIEMNKGQTLEDIKRSIKVFKDRDIMIHGMFMFGSDSDTSDIFETTSDFCSKNGIDYAQYTILTPLPGTELYAKLEKEGRILHKNWEYYDAMHVVFKPKNLTPRELQQGMIDCFSDFYSYTHAVNDALHTLVDTVSTVVKKLYKKKYFPSLYPSLVKFIGKGIVKKWVNINRSYLNYLGNQEQQTNTD